jgi:hypothetical protein
MVSPADPIEKVMDIIIWSILHHFDLLEDHHPLLLNIFYIQDGILPDRQFSSRKKLPGKLPLDIGL